MDVTDVQHLLQIVCDTHGLPPGPEGDCLRALHSVAGGPIDEMKRLLTRESDPNGLVLTGLCAMETLMLHSSHQWCFIDWYTTMIITHGVDAVNRCLGDFVLCVILPCMTRALMDRTVTLDAAAIVLSFVPCLNVSRSNHRHYTAIVLSLVHTIRCDHTFMWINPIVSRHLITSSGSSMVATLYVDYVLTCRMCDEMCASTMIHDGMCTDRCLGAFFHSILDSWLTTRGGGCLVLLTHLLGHSSYACIKTHDYLINCVAAHGSDSFCTATLYLLILKNMPYVEIPWDILDTSDSAWEEVRSQTRVLDESKKPRIPPWNVPDRSA